MKIHSPCVKKCKLINNICTGCKRTIEEITNWSRYSNKEKLDTLDRIDTSLSINKKDRAIGSFLGLAIGDALGAPVEFKEPGEFLPIVEYRAGGAFKLPADF